LPVSLPACLLPACLCLVLTNVNTKEGVPSTRLVAVGLWCGALLPCSYYHYSFRRAAWWHESTIRAARSGETENFS